MSITKGGIQLPDDVVTSGYRETRPFQYEQVFYSKAHDFKGTEREFIAAGLAYEYRESGFKRYARGNAYEERY